jgi:hypothetical protein
LEAIMRTRTILLAGLYASAGTAAAAAQQLVYTPVTPCRLIDTRLAGGTLAAGTVRDFKVTGSGHQGQGGNVAGCGVPAGRATAAVINFVAVNPVGPGNLRAWAYAEPPVPPPTASILNYASVAGLNIANGIPVPICDPSLTTCSFDLRVQADTSNTHLVGDVVGYFERAQSFSVFTKANTLTTIGATCTNITGLHTTVTAPVAGRIVVRANLSARINHGQGTADALRFLIGTSPTDCSGDFVFHFVGAALPTELYGFGLPIAASFDVAPGTYTYYGNAFMETGAETADIANASSNVSTIEATFYPDAAASPPPPPPCPPVSAPDTSGTVSGVIVVTCAVPGTACTVTQVGLRFAGGPIIGFDTGIRSNVVNWNTANHANGSYTLECYAHYHEGGSTSAASAVNVAN